MNYCYLLNVSISKGTNVILIARHVSGFSHTFDLMEGEIDTRMERPVSAFQLDNEEVLDAFGVRVEMSHLGLRIN